MFYLKTKEEIEKVRKSALLVSETLAQIAKKIDVGVTTGELDRIAEDYITKKGGVPSFKGYNGFPATLCISVNEEVVHGIPGNYALQSGDVLSVDCGAYLDGFHGDHAYSFQVGDVKPEVKELLDTTEESLYKGIAEAEVGKRIGDIGFAIQKYVQRKGYTVVRELTGHGLGRKLHEDPAVPNYGKRGRGMKIKEGMVLAVEPMINLGKRNVAQLSDGWTIVTIDGMPSAHFEHDIAVIDGKPEILSTFDYLKEELAKRQML